MKTLADLAQTIPLYPYAIARSAVFTAESFLAPLIELIVNGERPHLAFDDPGVFRLARAAHDDLIRRDIENIDAGIYPRAVLLPENPLRHLLRMPKMLLEGVGISRRRGQKASKEFSDAAAELLGDEGLPDYYKRNFHFQGDGYLSERSADLYEHQVEILFVGAADAMRRLILSPLKKRFADNADGAGLKFLEIGAGTGRATRFVRLAFPKAKIVALDLSSPYLKKAQGQLRSFAHHDFVEGDAARLPFLDGTFDAVFSIFLFHELPPSAREAVVADSTRVLKTGGFYGLVDSLQRGDIPAFDAALDRFPKQFHEPFFRDYSRHPIERTLEAHGLSRLETGTGFFAKVVSGVRG